MIVTFKSTNVEKKLQSYTKRLSFCKALTETAFYKAPLLTMTEGQRRHVGNIFVSLFLVAVEFKKYLVNMAFLASCTHDSKRTVQQY